jgi:hypothetical protein
MSIEEAKKEIKRYKELLKQPDCDFAAQTWIEWQIKELKAYLKYLKKEKN